MALWSLDAPERVDAQDDAVQAPSASLFGTAGWGRVLEGLGCQAVMVRSVALAETIVVPVFRRGPVKLGFMGFPICGGRLDSLSSHDFDLHAAELAHLLGLDIVRGTRAGRTAREAGACLPEVWTDRLAAWPGSLEKKLRRDIAFAERANSDLEIHRGGGSPEAWHALYAATVLGRGGKLRYTAEYFRRLAAEEGTRLHVFQAIDKQDAVRGFAVLAMDRGTGYYLHGGVDLAARKSGLSDLLLWRLMSHAQAAGLERFSLMASPEQQSGLVRFKRKWAELEGYSVTRDYGNGIAGNLALRAMGLLGMMRRDPRASATPTR